MRSTGPVELVLIEFPRSEFKGEIIAELGRLVDAGTIDVLDALLIRKGEDGTVEWLEATEGGDEELARFLAASLDDAATRAAVTAERSVLATLEAGCSAPIGALADVVSDYVEDAAGNDVIVDRLSLRAVIGTTTGALLRASGTAEMDNAEKLGASLALELLDMGADDLPNVHRSDAERIAGSGVQE